jgi:hypothetical protein
MDGQFLWGDELEEYPLGCDEEYATGTPLSAIRRNCLGCSGSYASVSNCRSSACPTYDFRGGKDPFRARPGRGAGKNRSGGVVKGQFAGHSSESSPEVGVRYRDPIPSKKLPANWRPLDAIRAYCMDCMGNNAQWIAECDKTHCDMHPYRFGTNPKMRRNEEATELLSRLKLSPPEEGE